ncbi:MAG TPA: glutamate 5-kinase [Chthoniobacterales bacterium]|nr:glutamate 5-kinase [Chthoniobacterales bacterium]
MKRIVVKLGTGILAKPGGRSLDPGQFRRLSREFAALVAEGHSVLVVSSGAVTAGVHALGLTERPTDLPGKQACASLGQPLLLREFERNLSRDGLHAAQLLLTHDDIDSRKRRVNARNTVERLLAARTVLPIFNENDSVAVEELNFGDNDRLSAEVALLVEADLLIILTSADGVLDADRKRVPLVRDIDSAFALVLPEKGANSVGGMAAKLAAVKIAVTGGVETVIADGRREGAVSGAAHDEDIGTRFPATRKRSSRRS